MGNKKLQVWLPLLFSIVMIGGMFFGFKMKDQAGTNSFFKTGKPGSLQETLDLIKQKYVDSIGMDTLQESAIQDVVNQLDPHSVYIPPSHLQEVNEDIMGRFEGIGVEFNVFDDTVNVVYVIPGGPSDKAGLQIGDKLLKANDSSLTTRSYSTDEIKKLIRGERNSKVILQILRGNRQLTIPVIRGTIPVPSVDAAYMVDHKTGYIRLNKFTETSYEEFMEAMERLQKEGLQQLILD